MKYIYITLIVLMIFSSFAFANMPMENKSSIVLTIEVVNKTENGTPVEDDQVTLQIFQHQQIFDVLEAIENGGNALTKIKSIEI